MSSRNESEQKISAIFVLEIVGRPPEHLTKTLEDIIEKLGKEKNVTIKENKIHEPVKMEKTEKELYNTFAEIEFETIDITRLSFLMFKYMPAHVDIISPENIKLSNNELNGILNEITRRIHGYDEVARVVQFEKKILEKKLREMIKELEELKNKNKD